MVLIIALGKAVVTRGHRLGSALYGLMILIAVPSFPVPLLRAHDIPTETLALRYLCISDSLCQSPNLLVVFRELD